MIYLIGIGALVTVGLDGWSNKWAICKSVAALFSNTYKKIAGKA